MESWQIALMILVVVLLAGIVWRRGRRTTSRADDELDRLDTLTGWPPQATRALSTAERIAFGTLTRALPDHMVLAQVPLSRFIAVPKRHSYAEWLRRVGYQSADFVICDMAAQVVAVIEIQPQQPGERARKRAKRMARTLQAAKIPLHVWAENVTLSVDAMRHALLPEDEAVAGPDTTPGASPNEIATASAVATAATKKAEPQRGAPGRNPFDDTGRDSTHDERIELLEPPPSTWYDEFDTDPVPLQKK